MITVRLAGGEWRYDPDAPLGRPGGFGAVFEGESPDRSPVAVKRLSLGAAAVAHRELRMAAALMNRDLVHVVPILDAGQDALSDGYFVVMPRADGSLDDALRSQGPFSADEAISVLAEIVSGLNEVSEIAHRDLKPGNVLSLHGRWCVGDFGIARFVEESTSDNTLRDFMTPQYAAPEQWLGETATGAADLYALGCIAYALLEGSPPFQGPTSEDFQRQHLEDTPPPLGAGSPPLRSLIAMLLRKRPDARPSLSRVIYLLGQSRGSPEQRDYGSSGLGEIGAMIAEREAQQEADRLAAQRSHESRLALADEAIRILGSLMAELFRRVRDEAPVARIDNDGRTIRLGHGRLSWTITERLVPESGFARSGWNVIVEGFLSVAQESELYGGRSANLFYTEAGTGGDLRWYEVSFMTSAFASQRYRDEPMALGSDDADLAAAPEVTPYQFAAPIRAIDDEDSDLFMHRWMERLALAADNMLARPSTLPETS